MNFGNKLLLVFAVFACLMAYMTYRCFGVPVDLVSNDYYKDEISYQDVIDGTKNANALSEKVSIKQQGVKVVIQLPNEMKSQTTKGTILFYCPSNLKDDRHFDLVTDGNGIDEIDAQQISKGHYTVKIDWKVNNKHFYSEQPLQVL